MWHFKVSQTNRRCNNFESFLKFSVMNFTKIKQIKAKTFPLWLKNISTEYIKFHFERLLIKQALIFEKQTVFLRRDGITFKVFTADILKLTEKKCVVMRLLPVQLHSRATQRLPLKVFMFVDS